LKFEFKTPWTTARRPKKPKKAQEGHLEEGKPQKPMRGKKSRMVKTELRGARNAQNQHRISKEQEKLKICRKAQNEHSPWNQLHLTLSLQALHLR
jgi:hypothetical protein